VKEEKPMDKRKPDGESKQRNRTEKGNPEEENTVH
jgi:hypothetical protein